ncbi:ABC transporter ATP-binding protein [Geodermatophilus sp. DF01-2]|uniref:ABC transporter ATP-binding protein n=1 Tax=Geodermatophilus sp. DF01-2 TaxID=2559610 RepID=UPI0010746D4E|nr:ABC transporter ATP-binding protein [Geodermatophilus sp. DF01_2]TFV61905.1 ABC transporter ATP-binding protein [Geodermatophilus sp. DF01_2]
MSVPVSDRPVDAKPILEARKLSKHFGGIRALHEVDFTVFGGEILGLIGPNGSGKTTLVNCMAGELRPTQGSVMFHGKDVTGRPAHRLSRIGLARTFQQLRIFGSLSVRENMWLARQWGGVGLAGIFRSADRATRARADHLIELVKLTRLVDAPAGTLSGGQRRLLEFGMAVMPRPSIVLLDEATSGVHPTVIAELSDHIKSLNREEGVAFLLIEHNVEFIMRMCHRVVVLHHGEELAVGTPDEVRRNDEVVDAYFGA